MTKVFVVLRHYAYSNSPAQEFQSVWWDKAEAGGECERLAGVELTIMAEYVVRLRTDDGVARIETQMGSGEWKTCVTYWAKEVEICGSAVSALAGLVR